MNEFDSIFGDQLDQDTEFDTMFASQDDGALIDAVAGVREDGSCETDFDELHQTDDDADIEDLEDDVVGCDTDNAPDDAEGTDDNPMIDLAMGESVMDTDEISAKGKKGESDADDWYPDDIRDEDKESTWPMEGRDVNMDPEDIDGEFEKMAEMAMGEDAEFDNLHQDNYDATPDDIADDIFGAETDNAPDRAEGTDDDPMIDLAMGEGTTQTDDIDYEDDGLVGDVGVLDKTDGDTVFESDDFDMDDEMEDLDDDDEYQTEDVDDYEDGDEALFDIVDGTSDHAGAVDPTMFEV